MLEPAVGFINISPSGEDVVPSAITVALVEAATFAKAKDAYTPCIATSSYAHSMHTVPLKSLSNSIQLRNQGGEAYEHGLYRDDIIVTHKQARKLIEEGSSSCKIRSRNAKAISTKKEEPAAICSYVNIQIDNPTTVLTHWQGP